MRLMLGLALLVPALAQQTMDADFAKSVKEFTTKPEFMSPLVDHLPKVPGIPTPKDFLGYHVGTPKKLTHYADIVKYFRALEKASKRIKIFSAGQTDEGREMIAAMVGDEATIANLETYRGYLAQLADPRKTPDAASVIAKAKPIYQLTGGLHASETGSPEMLMELAYRLVAEEGALYSQIRQNLIVSIVPALEPDGQERYTDWYYRHKINDTSEDDALPGPPYWGKYVLHDNNRDMHYSQIVMRNWLKFYLQWKAPIVHDLHESVPFLYTFSGQPPHNPNLDPILYAELPWFANYEMTKMIGYGMPGVWTHAFVDMWSVGYLGFMASNHNGMLRMYETYGNGGANTMKRKVQSSENDRFGAANRQWYRPFPAYKDVEWSLRNNTNYMQTGVLSALELASANSKTILDNFYRKSFNAVEAGKKEAPYGWTIPAGQRDQTRVALLINTLRLQGIEVSTKADGSFLIRRDQPYGRLAKSLLEKQVYPDPNLRTYDDTGWTMGTQFQVDVKEVTEKGQLDVPTQPVNTYDPRGSVSGQGQHLVVLHNGAHSMITLRARLKSAKFEALEKTWGDLPAGSLVTANTAAAREQIEKLGLVAKVMPELPDVPRHAVDLPRLAVYSTWGSTQEVGWVRHALDSFEVPYDLIFKERVKKGNLRGDYDVVLIPNQRGGSAKGIVFDIDCKGRSMAYTKTADFKSLGMYGETEEMCGGMGLEGVVEFEKFVTGGGVMITLAGASTLPAEFGLVRRVDASRPVGAFYAPGPILDAEIEKPSHPMFYGYTAKTVAIRYANGPLLYASEQDRQKWSLLKYPFTEKGILSGHIQGIGQLKDHPAVMDVPSGKGRVVMFATNPCYRWQTHSEFAMLFNSLLHFDDVK
jgi:hypothetical protein